MDLTALATTNIHAPAPRVWEALTNPAIIKEYMFGTEVASSWKKGDPITWSGTWKGNPYRDKGVILEIAAPRLLKYSHFSPLVGLPDIPENYHIVTIELTPKDSETHVSLSQDGNRSEEARAHSQENWEAMLTALKATLEG